MHTRFVVVFLSLYFSSASQGKKSFHPVITLRTNPFSFAEVDAGAVLGIGYQFLPQWSVSIDPMIVLYSPYKFSREYPDEHEPVSGYKIRGDIKYYFRDFNYGKRGGFIALEFHYKKVTAKKWDSFGMNCVNGQCDFFQRTQYGEEKREEGIAVKAGLIRRLWSPRWAIEIYTGIGFKFKHFNETDLPAGGSFITAPSHDVTISSFQENGAYPIIPAGAKLIYRLF